MSAGPDEPWTPQSQSALAGDPATDPGVTMARRELDARRRDTDFVGRYLAGDAHAREIMADLHQRANPTEADDSGEAGPETTPHWHAGHDDFDWPEEYERRGVPDAALEHLPDGLRPPARAQDYQLPPKVAQEIGINGMIEVQSWLHSAGLPKGLAEVIVTRAEAITPPANAADDSLRERVCDAELARHFKGDFEAGFESLEKLAQAMDRQYPGLSNALDRAGYFTDTAFMLAIMRHALNVYGPRPQEDSDLAF